MELFLVHYYGRNVQRGKKGRKVLKSFLLQLLKSTPRQSRCSRQFILFPLRDIFFLLPKNFHAVLNGILHLIWNQSLSQDSCAYDPPRLEGAVPVVTPALFIEVLSRHVQLFGRAHYQGCLDRDCPEVRDQCYLGVARLLQLTKSLIPA